LAKDDAMAKASSFYDYFRENMKTLGLPAPQSLFGTLTTALATIGAMSKYVEKYGNGRTVAEMADKLRSTAAGAGAVGVSVALQEVVLVGVGMSAAFYVGACIGSLAVATGRSLSGGLTIADYLHAAHVHGVGTEDDSWLVSTIHAHPALVK
jgi:hypothetical protein